MLRRIKTSLLQTQYWRRIFVLRSDYFHSRGFASRSLASTIFGLLWHIHFFRLRFRIVARMRRYCIIVSPSSGALIPPPPIYARRFPPDISKLADFIDFCRERTDCIIKLLFPSLPSGLMMERMFRLVPFLTIVASFFARSYSGQSNWRRKWKIKENSQKKNHPKRNKERLLQLMVSGSGGPFSCTFTRTTGCFTKH